MASFNKVLLLGNLTRDPEIKYTPKGTAVTEFGLAVNRHYTTEAGEKREEVTFVNLVAYARQAEIIGEFCKKGKPLFVEGRLKLEQWDDKQSGQKRSATKVIVETFQLLGGRPEGAAATTTAEEEPPPQKARPAARPRPPADPDLDAADPDIPF